MMSCPRLVVFAVAGLLSFACGSQNPYTNPISATPTSSSGATVVSVTVGVPSPTLAAGTAMLASATANYSDGISADITAHASTTWSSSASGIATVSASGRVLGVSRGSTTISAQHGGYTGSVSVTVTPAASVGAPTPIWPIGGETIEDLTPHFRVQSGSNQGDVGEVIYEIQVATAASASSVFVTASTHARSGETSIALRPAGSTTETSLSGSRTYHWRARARNDGVKTQFLPDASQTVNAVSEIRVGSNLNTFAPADMDEAGLALMGMPGDPAAPGDLPTVVVDPSTWTRWYSFRTAAAPQTYTLSGRVTDTNNAGLSEALIQVLDGTHQGSSTRTNSAGNFSLGGLSGNLNFQVKKDGYTEQRFGANPNASSFTVALERSFTFHVEATTSRLEPGESTTVRAEIRFTDGTDERVYPTWSSSNAGVATVTSGGLVRAIAEGTVRITGEYQGRSGYAEFEVKNEPLAEANLSSDKGNRTSALEVTWSATYTFYMKNDGPGCATSVNWTLTVKEDVNGQIGPDIQAVTGSLGSRIIRAGERFTLTGGGLDKLIEYWREDPNNVGGKYWWNMKYNWLNTECSSGVMGPSIISEYPGVNSGRDQPKTGQTSDSAAPPSR